MHVECVHELFEAQVERTPHALAVVFEDQQLTFRELNEQANQLANYLRRLGAGPDVLIGLYMEHSVTQVASLLGILKAGAAYVPFDTGYPKERLAFLLDDISTPVLLTQQHLLPTLPACESLTVCPEAARHVLDVEDRGNPARVATTDNLAYVIYTSGSTGKPKGVLVPHRGLVNYLTWCAQAYPTRAGIGAPVHSPLSFDLTVTSLFVPLLAGRTVYLLREGPSIDKLAEALRSRSDFSLVKLTPVQLELLAQQLSPHEAAGRTRSFIIGGENLTSAQTAFWQTFAPNTILINEYGPTETVVGCCVYQVPPGKHASGSIPIGRPIAGTQLYVLDADLRPVPAGEPGELYIGGAGVARGYHNRPELTAEKFIPNPFSQEPGARLYATGDLVRSLPDGNLEFLGRVDHQVKFHGYRIELEEIETVLGQHPAVKHAIVSARRDDHAGQRLAAYIVPNSGYRLTTRAMRHFLRDQLPEYMVPATLQLLDAYPLTCNGKVDRAALPPPSRADFDVSYAVVSPRNLMESRMARLWEEVLNVGPIGADDHFFDLGGDSVLAVQLLTKIDKNFGVRLPPAILLSEGTVERLVALIDRANPAASWPSLVEIQPRGSHPPFFCVHGIGGEVLSFARLGQHLAPDQPFFGLQARRLEEGPLPPSTIETLAAQYVEEVRARQPEGPYYLGGFSFGGTVAFEMARQLQAHGQRVALLAVIDQTAPTVGENRGRSSASAVLAFLTNLPAWIRYDFLRTRPTALLARLRLKIPAFRRRIMTLMGRRVHSSDQADLGHEFDVHRLPETFVRLLQRHYQALQGYAPRPFAGGISLLKARAQPLFGFPGRDLGWGQLTTGAVEVTVIPGSHDNLLEEPYVRLLAQRLRDCLQAARDVSQSAAVQHPSGSAPPSSSGSAANTEGLLAASRATNDDRTYKVVVNALGQYSIWPADRENALGWDDAGKSGSKTECLASVRDVWNDLKRRSVPSLRNPLNPLLATETLSPMNRRRMRRSRILASDAVNSVQQKLALLVVCVTVIGLLVPLPIEYRSACLDKLQDLGQLPLFALMTVCLWQITGQRIWWAFSLAAVLAVATEVGQEYIDHSGEFLDVPRSLLGSLMAVLWLGFPFRPFQWRGLAIRVVMTLAFAAWPIWDCGPTLVETFRGHRSQRDPHSSQLLLSGTTLVCDTAEQSPWSCCLPQLAD